MVEVFKTNVDQVDASQELITELNLHYPACKINFDLDDCDRILRIEGPDFCVDTVSRILIHHHFSCEILV